MAMQQSDAALLGHLQALEVELHQPAVRGDATRLDALIHPEFREFGRSGTAYTRDDILAQLLSATERAQVVADHFVVRRLATDVALLTYRSAHLLPDGTLHRFTLRASVWQRSSVDWQMSFHQGTPTGPQQTS
jgi:hypothetical protein